MTTQLCMLADCLFGIITFIALILPSDAPMGIRLILIIFTILPMYLLAGGVKRIKSQRRRNKILKRKHRKAIGVFSGIGNYDTGKETTVSVTDGYTQKLFSPDIYKHYHYEKRKIYDGFIATFELCSKDGGFYYTGDKMTIRTAPPSFWGYAEEFPQEDGMFEITYVKGPDGMNYFLDAQPAH